MQTGFRFLFFLFFSISLGAQSDIQFVADTDTERLLPRQSFEVSYTLENASGTDFTPPDFSPFEVLRGPSISNSLQIINGRRSSSITYSFVLAAPGPGKYTIPPASIQAEGQSFNSGTLRVEVVPKGSDANAGRQQDVYVQYELSTDSPYIGEALLLDLVLYSKKRVQNVYKRNDPDRSGWYSLILPGRPPARNTVVNGQSYRRQVLNRELLFAQKSGPHLLESLYLQVDLEDENNKRSSPFSFFRSYDRQEIYVPDTAVWVRSLPQPVPAHFSGLVGDTELEGQLKTARISLGDAAEYTVRLESFSDPNIISPPRVISENAEVLQPQLTYEGKEDFSQGRKYIYIYEYLVIPDSLGTQSIFPQIIYFDTQKEKYDTLSGATQDLWVSEKRVETPEGSEDALADGEGPPPSEPSDGLSWWWLSAPLLVVLLWLVFRFKRNDPAAVSPSDSLEHRLKDLLRDDRPDPRELRDVLKQLIARDEGAGMNTDQWQRYLRELDYLVYSPLADEGEWDRIMTEWRSDLDN